jgi:MFS family permease
VKQPFQSSIWSFPDLRLVLPARAVSYAGDSIALMALMLRVSHEGGPGAVTALLLAFALPTVVMIPFAGRIVDGRDSRTVLVWASLLQAAAGLGLDLHRPGGRRPVGADPAHPGARRGARAWRSDGWISQHFR